MDQPDGIPLVRRDDDHEGTWIQFQGVAAIVYSPELWTDSAALLAVMREDNLDADVKKGETELESFGTACRVVAQMSVCDVPEAKVIKVDDVMEQIAALGYGSMARDDWEHLVGFRLFMSTTQATMLTDCLFQICNGRIRIAAKAYSDIQSLHPKGFPWMKICLLIETYCAELLNEETGLHRQFSHKGPGPKTAKTLDAKCIRLLAREKPCSQSCQISL